MEFSGKLNLLFERNTRRDGSRYSQEEVIRGTQGVLTRAYLWKLRTGRAKNPGFNIVQALADFFEVDLNYFRSDTNQPEDLIEKSIREGLFKELVLRASMYSDETLVAMIGMMEYVEKNLAGKSAAQSAGRLPGMDSDE